MPSKSDRIEREVVIDAPPQRVWTVLTEGRHLGVWFGDAGAEIDLRPGGELICRWQDHGTIRAIVTVVEPPHRFGFRWAGPLSETPFAGNATDVEFTLTPHDDGTLLHVLESGFSDLDLDDDERARYRADNQDGWVLELEELRCYLAEVAA